MDALVKGFVIYLEMLIIVIPALVCIKAFDLDGLLEELLKRWG